MSSIFSSATEIAALAGARRPEWSAKLSSQLAAVPQNLNEGWLVQDAVQAHLHVTLREKPRARTAYIEVPVFDASTTYTVTIDGTTYTTTPKASKALVLADMVTQLSAVTGLTAALAAAGTDAMGRVHAADEAVRVNGLTTVAVGASGGTGTILADADAESALLQLYATHSARLGSTAPAAWVRYGEPLAVGPEGLSQLVRVGGVERLSARVWVAGHTDDGVSGVETSALIHLGPGLSES